MRCSILQTCVPPYRVPLFDGLAAGLGSGFRVVAGERFFDSSIRTQASGASWYVPCDNKFLAGNRLLWQEGKAVSRLLDGPFVVEGNPRSLRTWLLLAHARVRGIPTAIWGHALGRKAGSTEMALSRRAMFSLASTIICYCYSEQQPLQRRFPRKTVLVAGNSTVRRSECVPLSAPAEHRNSVLFLGRLVSAKKPLLLLRALKELQNEGNNLGAVFVGDGPERETCENFARTEELRNVLFVGSCFDRARIREVAASCFAVASPGYVGLSVLDAQSLGLPVIYCREEPNAPEVEILQDGFNAAAFSQDSAASLAKAISEMYVTRDNWLAGGEIASRAVAEKYSIEGMIETFTAFFKGRRSPV